MAAQSLRPVTKVIHILGAPPYVHEEVINGLSSTEPLHAVFSEDFAPLVVVVEQPIVAGIGWIA